MTAFSVRIRRELNRTAILNRDAISNVVVARD